MMQHRVDVGVALILGCLLLGPFLWVTDAGAQARDLQCATLVSGVADTKTCLTTFPDTGELVMSVCASNGGLLSTAGVTKTVADALFDKAVTAFAIPSDSTIRVMVDAATGHIEFVVAWQGGRLRLQRQEPRTESEVGDALKQGGNLWVRH